MPLNYARGERFDHDPALKFGAVPRLRSRDKPGVGAAELKPFMKVGLVREANKVRATLRDARRELSDVGDRLMEPRREAPGFAQLRVQATNACVTWLIDGRTA